MATEKPNEARFQHALALYQRGEFDQALAELYSLVTVQPGHRDAWWMIAQIAPYPPQKEQAVRHVLEIDPVHEGARALAARLRLGALPAHIPGIETDVPGALPAWPDEEPYSLAYSQPVTVPDPTEPERHVVYVERPRRELQPFLVFNGGCMSGCLSLVLTVITVVVLVALIAGDAISRALQEAGTLVTGESASLSLVLATVVTLLAAVVQSVLTAVPVDGFISNIWMTLGYPSSAGQAVLQQLGTVGTQLSSVGGFLLVIFLGFWGMLAFLFVFLRARSNRMLHWALSTLGLWVLALLGCGLGALVFRLVQ